MAMIIKKWILFDYIPLNVVLWCSNNGLTLCSNAEQIEVMSSVGPVNFAGKITTTLVTESDEQETMLRVMLGDNMECIYTEIYDEKYGVIQNFK
jgi:hypothetical protein